MPNFHARIARHGQQNLEAGCHFDVAAALTLCPKVVQCPSQQASALSAHCLFTGIMDTSANLHTETCICCAYLAHSQAQSNAWSATSRGCRYFSVDSINCCTIRVTASQHSCHCQSRAVVMGVASGHQHCSMTVPNTCQQLGVKFPSPSLSDRTCLATLPRSMTRALCP